tara:strand:+ start:663 stop:1214 length:552 start_codon:yes stop_codon:yes gene_type:complete
MATEETKDSNITHGVQDVMKNINFNLEIETTNTTPVPENGLMNRFEEPDSQIVSITHDDIRLYNNEKEDFDYLLEDDLNQPGYYGNEITFHQSYIDRKTKEIIADTKKTYYNDKGLFTIKEMVDNIVDFEKLDRPSTKWFGGIDCHHTYYEGIFPNKEKTTIQLDSNDDIYKSVTSYYISWGS